MNTKEIGRRLRQARGVFRTRAEVAKAVGVTVSALGQYERGQRVPGDQTKIALAEYYGTTVQELFFA